MNALIKQLDSTAILGVVLANRLKELLSNMMT